MLALSNAQERETCCSILSFRSHSSKTNKLPGGGRTQATEQSHAIVLWRRHLESQPYSALSFHTHRRTRYPVPAEQGRSVKETAGEHSSSRTKQRTLNNTNEIENGCVLYSRISDACSIAGITCTNFIDIFVCLSLLLALLYKICIPERMLTLAPRWISCTFVLYRYISDSSLSCLEGKP